MTPPNCLSFRMVYFIPSGNVIPTVFPKISLLNNSRCHQLYSMFNYSHHPSTSYSFINNPQSKLTDLDFWSLIFPLRQKSSTSASSPSTCRYDQLQEKVEYGAKMLLPLIFVLINIGYWPYYLLWPGLLFGMKPTVGVLIRLRCRKWT